VFVTIHRVKHGTIPVTAFKPNPADNYHPKVLRWFRDTSPIPNDCHLRVEDESDGEFVLWVHFSSSINTPEIAATMLGYGPESLNQATVDKIQVAPVCDLARGIDFVIFQEPPLA
jgi:hypothetical protein